MNGRRYSYPGCLLADGYCPKDLTLSCALKSIAQTYDECRGDADCVLAPLNSLCTDQGYCPPFVVNDAGAASFQSLAQSEINRYCAGAHCSSEVLCAALTYQAICNAGRCGVWINPTLGFEARLPCPRSRLPSGEPGATYCSAVRFVSFIAEVDRFTSAFVWTCLQVVKAIQTAATGRYAGPVHNGVPDGRTVHAGRGCRAPTRSWH